MIVRGAILNEAQIINEFEEIKQIFPGSKIHRINDLIDHLISFTQLQTFEQICISTINIASMKYSFKDQRCQEIITAKIFNLNLAKEVNVAENFLLSCIEIFVSTTVQDYKIGFSDMKKYINNRIEDSLRIHGQFNPRQQRVEVEEVKNQEGKMIMQQSIHYPEYNMPVGRAKDPQQKVFAILSSFNDKSLDLFKFIRVLIVLCTLPFISLVFFCTTSCLLSAIPILTSTCKIDKQDY